MKFICFVAHTTECYPHSLLDALWQNQPKQTTTTNRMMNNNNNWTATIQLQPTSRQLWHTKPYWIRRCPFARRWNRHDNHRPVWTMANCSPPVQSLSNGSCLVWRDIGKWAPRTWSQCRWAFSKMVHDPASSENRTYSRDHFWAAADTPSASVVSKWYCLPTPQPINQRRNEKYKKKKWKSKWTTKLQCSVFSATTNLRKSVRPNSGIIQRRHRQWDCHLYDFSS